VQTVRTRTVSCNEYGRSSSSILIVLQDGLGVGDNKGIHLNHFLNCYLWGALKNTGYDKAKNTPGPEA
jgi:hypothetical protein